jgi:ABC-type polysaccharide/polyol phosphate export permease
MLTSKMIKNKTNSNKTNSKLIDVDETLPGLTRIPQPIATLIRERKLIWDLSLRAVVKNYFGSSLGILWLFLEQIVFIVVLWFIFSKGLKFSGKLEVAFLPWFMSGYIVWIYLSKCIGAMPMLFPEYSYLLKKWRFKASLIPMVNTVQHLIIHTLFLVLLAFIFIIYNINVSVHFFQLLYYLASTFVFLTAVSLIVSSVSLFIKDIKYVVAILIQLGFWVSPIYWETSFFPIDYHFYLKLNPVHYLVQGYRDSFIYHIPFWHRTGETIYFWCFTAVLLAIGTTVYKKLRPHFGDVI